MERQKITPWDDYVNMAKVVAKKTGEHLFCIRTPDGGHHIRRLSITFTRDDLRPGEFHITPEGESFERLEQAGLYHRTVFHEFTHAQVTPL